MAALPYFFWFIACLSLADVFAAAPRKQPRAEILECLHPEYKELTFSASQSRVQFHFLNTERRTERPHMRGAKVYLVPELRPVVESLNFEALRMIPWQRRWQAEYARRAALAPLSNDAESQCSNTDDTAQQPSKNTIRSRLMALKDWLKQSCRQQKIEDLNERFNFDQWFLDVSGKQPDSSRTVAGDRNRGMHGDGSLFRYARHGPIHWLGRSIARRFYRKLHGDGSREYIRRESDLKVGLFELAVAQFEKSSTGGRWRTGYTLDLDQYEAEMSRLGPLFSYRVYIVRGGWSGLHTLLGTSEETVRLIDNNESNNLERKYHRYYQQLVKTGVNVREESHALLIEFRVPDVGVFCNAETEKSVVDYEQKSLDGNVVFTDWRLRFSLQLLLNADGGCNWQQRLELRAFIQPLVSLEDHPSCYPTTRTPVQPLFYQSSAVVMDTSFELSQYAFDPEFPVSLEEISSNDSEMELYTATGDEGKPFRLLRVHLYKQKKPDTANFGHILYHSATEHENDEQNSDETSSTKKSKFDAFPFHRWLMSRNT